MIKANELRIGNWVKYKQYSSIKVESVGAHGVNLEAGDGGMYWDSYEDLSPIPLTTEILEKVNDAGFGYIMQNVHEIRKGEFSYDLWAKEMKYLHQLQNLIYILTGEELEIKL